MTKLRPAQPPDEQSTGILPRIAHRPRPAIDEPLAHGRLAIGTAHGLALSAGQAEPRYRTRITYLTEDSSVSELLGDDGGGERQKASGLLRASRVATRADRIPLRDIMGRRVVCVRPEMTTDDLISLLVNLELRAVPVVDPDGRPIGVVSRSDLLRRWRDESAPRAIESDERVADVMMCLSFTLPETATISRAAALLAYEGVHRIPVVGPTGKVIGIVSTLDIARWLAQHDGYVVPDDRGQDA